MSKRNHQKARGYSAELQNLPERNHHLIAKMQYNYIFLPGSSIFHTRDCPCVLHARKIEGSVSFGMAAKGRTPCRICNPSLEIQAEPHTETVEPENAKKRQKPIANQDEMIKARLLGGNIVEIRRGKIVGFCHNLSHPGKLTKGILDEHRCLAKQCPFLERYEDAPFWIQRKAKKLAKHRSRQCRKERKALLNAEVESMAALRVEFQKFADTTNSEMEIIRVERPNLYSYTVFYVSDNPFEDADRFPQFLDAVRADNNWNRINLRHVKDIDGHFVTCEEYHARKR